MKVTEKNRDSKVNCIREGDESCSAKGVMNREK